jgi:hypothetical protein
MRSVLICCSTSRLPAQPAEEWTRGVSDTARIVVHVRDNCWVELGQVKTVMSVQLCRPHLQHMSRVGSSASSSNSAIADEVLAAAALVPLPPGAMQAVSGQLMAFGCVWGN